jgi:hypothetical protein
MRNWLAAVAIALLVPCTSGAARAGAVILGPGPGLTGNNTGGIIAYSPELEHGVYRRVAADWCARWGRLSHVTSVHRIYGDYVGFVCIDRPRIIH